MFTTLPKLEWKSNNEYKQNIIVLRCKLDAFIVQASNLLSSCHGIVTPRKSKESVLTSIQQTLQKRDNSQQYVKTKKNIYAQVWKVNTKHLQVKIDKFIYTFYTTYTLITKLKNKETIAKQNNKHQSLATTPFYWSGKAASKS